MGEQKLSEKDFPPVAWMHMYYLHSRYLHNHLLALPVYKSGADVMVCLYRYRLMEPNSA